MTKLTMHNINVFKFVIFFMTSIITIHLGQTLPSIPNGEEYQSKNTIKLTDLEVLRDDAVDWAHHIGMLIRTKEQRDGNDVARFAPVTLFPTPVPRKIFMKAKSIQTAMNLLYFRVARDFEFLEEVHKKLAETDETLKKLMKMYLAAHSEGIKQPISLMFQRADYMTHVSKELDNNGAQQYQLKQIEVNNGAPAGLIVNRVTQLHRRTLTKAGITVTDTVIPPNESIHTLARGLYLAWKQFGNPAAIIVIVVPKLVDVFHFEDRYVGYELECLSEYNVKIVYLSMEDCYKRLSLMKDFSLRLDEYIVGLVYFCMTMLSSPENLPIPFLNARWKIERSTAIKCPSMGMIMASTKKVQQVLAKPGMVERFFPDPDDFNVVKAIRSTFADMWGLEGDDEQTKAVLQDAISNPDRYVLKPNREGGGNNIWGQKIADKLTNFTPTERAEHILMQKLKPMVTKNYFLQPLEELKFGEVTTELSTFGVVLGNVHTGNVLHNAAGGHMLRTKWAHIDEGGISLGTGVFDSRLLF